MCKPWLKYSLAILLLFFYAQSHAVLTDQEIDTCRKKPYVFLMEWFKKMEPLNQLARPSHTGLAIQKIELHIPIYVQGELIPFGKPVVRVEIVSVFDSNISRTGDIDENFLDLAVIVHHADNTYQLASPKIVNSPGNSSREKKLDIHNLAIVISTVLVASVEPPYSCTTINERISKLGLSNNSMYLLFKSGAFGRVYRSKRGCELGGEFNSAFFITESFSPIFYPDGKNFLDEEFEEAQKNFSKSIRTFVNSTIIEKIKNNTDLKKKSSNGITLIFLGCGTGREVFIGGKEILKGLNVPVFSHGIDIDSVLIEEGRKRFSDYLTEHCTLSTGDALDANSIIRQRVEKSNPDGLVVVIAIGLLADEAIPKTYQTHRILQEIAQNKTVDMICEAHLGVHHYTGETARAAGWDVEKHSVVASDLSQTYQALFPSPADVHRVLTDMLNVLTPLSLETQAEEIAQKHCSNVLDLSLSSHPVGLFQHIVKQHSGLKFRTVDISWGYLEDDETRMDEFIRLMQEYNVHSVAVSGYEPWLSKFQSKTMLTPLNIIKRIDSRGEFELPAMPLHLARQIWSDYEVYEEASSASSKIHHDNATGLSKAKIQLGNSEKTAVVADDEGLSLPLQQLGLDPCPVKPSGEKK